MIRNRATFACLAVLIAFCPALSHAQQTKTVHHESTKGQVKTATPRSVSFLPAATYGSGGTPGSVVLADVNGDSYPDIIVANSSCCGTSGVGVLLGNGDGTFQPVRLTRLSNVVELNALAVADVNADGKRDIIVATCCDTGKDAQAMVLLGNGDGTFQPPVPYDLGGTSPSIRVADVNGDGRPDIVSANFNSASNSTLTVLLGKGDGTFHPAISSPTLDNAACLTVDDLNNDGMPDAIVCGGVESIGVMLGNGDGTFQSSAESFTGFCTTTVAVADLNGKGFPDLIAANSGMSGCGSQGFAGILIGNGSGTFQPEVDYAATRNNAFGVGDVVLADLNGDGKQDVMITSGITAGGANGSVAVLLGNGDGTFQSATLFGTNMPASIAIAAADLNGDGKPDLVFGSLGTTNVSVLLNNTGIPQSTTTTLTSSLSTSTYGQRVTLTATVTNNGGSVPTGIVTFTWGIYTVGSAFLNSSGVATLSLATLNADTFPLTAVYKGDSNNLGSTSPVVNQVVNQATSSATLTSSPNPSNVGQAVTFTAKITSPTVRPGGPVTFTAGKTTLGTVNLTAGKATFTTSSLPAGSTAVTVTFAGDSDIQGSSASVTQTLTSAGSAESTPLNSGQSAPKAKPNNANIQCGSSIAVSASGGGFVFDAVTFSAKVNSNNYCRGHEMFSCGGVITFYQYGSPLGTVNVNAQCTATFATTLSAGNHTIKATYFPGQGWNTSSTSVTYSVSKFPTTTVLASTPNPSVDRQLVAITATVTTPTGVPPTGRVRFWKNGVAVANIALDSFGVATFNDRYLPVGSDTITADYHGDSDYAPSTTVPLIQVVNPATLSAPAAITAAQAQR